MDKRIISRVKTIVVSSILLMFLNTNISNAQINLEKEYIKLVNGYKSEDIIVDNGISIRMDETLDLYEFRGCKMSNDDTITIDSKGIVRPIKEGTVFLSKEINNKIHILEIYISSSKNDYNKGSKNTIVNRDYYKVFIDPGHGGNDNGASGNGYLEDELNLQISKKIENKLKQKGIDVEMSRTSDYFLTLGERAIKANEYGADVFISIHQNSANSSSASGIETYYHKNKLKHKPYSDIIQKQVILETKAKDRGVKSADFAVVRETDMPAALFESGFISNKEESKKLANTSYQDKIAIGISNAIESYLKDNVILTVNADSLDGKLNPGWNQINGNWYYSNEDKKIQTGWKSLGGEWYFFDEYTGRMLENQWYKDSMGSQYYLKPGGYMACNEELYLGGSYFRFNSNGRLMENEWYSDKEKMYFYKKDGYRAKNEWINIGESWFRFNENYEMLENQWYKDSLGSQYYFKSGGYMVYNEELYLGGSYFRFNSYGRLMENEWYKHNGNTYFYKKDGYKAKNEWINVGGSKFRFDEDSHMLEDRWYFDGEHYYWLKTEGYMAKNEVVTIANEQNKFDENGIWKGIL